MSIAQHDDELEAFEQEHDRGEPWVYPRNSDEAMRDDMPNPLVVRVTGLSTGTVKGEELTFLNGVDKTGKRWSRILGAKVLKDRLLDGVLSKWDDDRQAFVETARIGPVQAGDLVSIQFKGWREAMSGPNKGQAYPDLKVERRPGGSPTAAEDNDPGVDVDRIAGDPERDAGDGIPF